MRAPWHSDAIVVPLTTTKHIGGEEHPTRSQQCMLEVINRDDHSGKNLTSKERVIMRMALMLPLRR